MATATTPPVTVPPGDLLYEVVDGRIVEKPSMGSFETEIASALDQLFGYFVRTHRLGKVVVEMLFRIDQAKDLQRRPDLAFISNERWPCNRRAPRESPWDLVPDLAIEVISPSNQASEVQKKVHEYFAAGVRQVWVVYPDTCEIFVYDSLTRIRVLQRGDELDGAPLVPGFRLPVATLFEDEAQ